MISYTKDKYLIITSYITIYIYLLIIILIQFNTKNVLNIIIIDNLFYLY